MLVAKYIHLFDEKTHLPATFINQHITAHWIPASQAMIMAHNKKSSTLNESKMPGLYMAANINAIQWPVQ